MAASTKDRIVERSAELFRRQGFAGTGVKQIVQEASAPFGSLYHFFPGGKQQLGEEVIRSSGALFGELIDLFFTPRAEPVSATRRFFAAAADALEVSSTNEPLRRACADVFDEWIEKASARLRAYGVPRRRARELAVTLLA